MTGEKSCVFSGNVSSEAIVLRPPSSANLQSAHQAFSCFRCFPAFRSRELKKPTPQYTLPPFKYAWKLSKVSNTITSSPTDHLVAAWTRSHPSELKVKEHIQFLVATHSFPKFHVGSLLSSSVMRLLICWCCFRHLYTSPELSVWFLCSTH